MTRKGKRTAEVETCSKKQAAAASPVSGTAGPGCPLKPPTGLEKHGKTSAKGHTLNPFEAEEQVPEVILESATPELRSVLEKVRLWYDKERTRSEQSNYEFALIVKKLDDDDRNNNGERYGGHSVKR
jgi:hypothetical protein